jgi:hypothetical protein
LNPFQAAKGRDVEFDGISDLPASDNDSMNTADKPSLDRQGSIQVKFSGDSFLKIRICSLSFICYFSLFANSESSPIFKRIGSFQYRERMIAHSTALESITMEVGDPNLPRPSIVGGIR